MEKSITWSINLRFKNQLGAQEPFTELLLSSSRKFHKVTVNGFRFSSNNILETFQKLGPDLIELSLFNCNVEDTNLFVKFLKLMPEARKIIIYETTVKSEFSSPADELPPFTNLTTLELYQCQPRFLRYFKKAQLTTLKVYNSDEETMQQADRAPLLDLLSTQSKLETLALRMFVSSMGSDLFATPIPTQDIPFKLKKLSLLTFKLQHATEEFKNLLNFFKLHCETLEELELGRMFPDSIYEIAFAECKKLKLLRIIGSALPEEDQFYNQLKSNESVSTLVFIDIPQMTDEWHPMYKLLVKLPNLRNLVFLDDLDGDDMQAIPSDLKQLESVTIEKFSGFFNKKTCLPRTLTALNISIVGHPVNFEAFFKANAGITDLTIKKVSNESFEDSDEDFDDEGEDFDIEAVTKHLKLQKLTIKGDIKLDEDFFNAIRVDCSKLKTLDLNEENLEVDLSEIVALSGLILRKDEPLKYPAPTTGEFWHSADYKTKLTYEDDDVFDSPRYGSRGNSGSEDEDDDEDDDDEDEEDDSPPHKSQKLM